MLLSERINNNWCNFCYIKHPILPKPKYLQFRLVAFHLLVLLDSTLSGTWREPDVHLTCTCSFDMVVADEGRTWRRSGSLRDAWQTLQPPLKAALYWLVSWLAGLGRDLVQNQPCDLKVRWTFPARMPAVRLCNDRKILWNHVYCNRNSLKKYQWSIFKTEFSSEFFFLFFFLRS